MNNEEAHLKIQFLRALDTLIDLHHGRLKAMTTAAVPQPHHNRFISFFEHLGHDFKVGLPIALQIAETGGKTAVQIFAPAASLLFNQTLAAIATAEQNAQALGAVKAGPQKLAAVVQLMGGLIEQGLTDANQPAALADVEKYIEAALTIAKATVITVPAPVAEIPLASAPAPVISQSQPIAQTEAQSGPSLVSSTVEEENPFGR